MVRINVRIHESFKVMRSDTASQDNPYRVGEKMDRVMIFDEAGILRKEAALVRIFDVRFKRQLPILAGHLEQLIHDAEQLEILRLRDCSTGQHLGERGQNLYDHFDRRRNQHNAQGGTQDDDELGGLDEHPDVASLHEITAQDSSKHQQYPDKSHGLSLLHQDQCAAHLRMALQRQALAFTYRQRQGNLEGQRGGWRDETRAGEGGAWEGACPT